MIVHLIALNTWHHLAQDWWTFITVNIWEHKWQGKQRLWEKKW